MTSTKLKWLVRELWFIGMLGLVAVVCFWAVPSVTPQEVTSPLDKLFPTDRVLDVQISVAEQDWDTIRLQSRTIYTALRAERQLKPLKDPYTYVPAKLTIDGQEFPEVGLRKKGFIGSQNSTRPSLKIKLDHINKDSHIGGLANLTFNNNQQDVSLMSQFMGYALFNRTGSPAPRCSYAKITVNGENLGVYTHIETIREPLLKREFGDHRGVLYEGTVVDFFEGWDGSFEKKVGKKKVDRVGREKIGQLIGALQSREGTTILSSEAMGRGWVPSGQAPGKSPSLTTYPDPVAAVNASLQGLETRIAALQQALQTQTPELAAAQIAWEAEQLRQGLSLSPWSVIGPFRAASFDEAYSQDFAPENEVALDNTYDGMKWNAVVRFQDGQPWPLSAATNAATYLFRNVRSTTARDLPITVGSDDSIKLWLNGNLTFENKIQRGVGPDRDQVVLNLVPGENQLLMKIVNGAGQSGFFFRADQELLPPSVASALQVSAGERDASQQAVLRQHFLANAPELAGARNELRSVIQEHNVFWTGFDFDDSSWKSGRNGAGYERGQGYESMISEPFDVVDEMFGKTASVYLRLPFEIANLEDVLSKGDLILRMKYDDGFVAYLNGHRVASANAPQWLGWDSKATSGHDDPAALKFESFNISEHKDKLREGNNVIAIHGLNIDSRSSDMLIVAELETNDYDPEVAVEELVDLDAFYTFWAVEGLLGFWDGYSGNRNNFFIYLNPKNDKFHFLPWGADCLFEKFSKLRVDRRAPYCVKTKGLLAHKLYQSQPARERYRRRLMEVIRDQWDEDALLAETRRIETMLEPHLSEFQKRSVRREKFREFIRNRREDIVAETAAGMPIWTSAPGAPPIIGAAPKRNAPAGKSRNPRRAANRSIWVATKLGDIGAIKRHLAKGVQVDARDDSGESPLAIAALSGQAAAAKFLLEEGADVNGRNNEGNTALHSASFLGRLNIVQLLVQKGSAVNAINQDGVTALDVTSEPWNDDIHEAVVFVGGLLQLKIDPAQVKSDRPKAVALLRKLGGKSAAELAKMPTADFWNAAKTGNTTKLEQLLDNGADSDGLNDEGLSVLAWAAMCGQVKAVQVLIQHGSDVNQRNRDGSTALHGAALLGRIDVVELLIENKADINASNDENQTPLATVTSAWNAETQKVAEFMSNLLGIPVDLKQIQAARPRIAQILRDHGATPRKK